MLQKLLYASYLLMVCSIMLMGCQESPYYLQQTRTDLKPSEVNQVINAINDEITTPEGLITVTAEPAPEKIPEPTPALSASEDLGLDSIDMIIALDQKYKKGASDDEFKVDVASILEGVVSESTHIAIFYQASADAFQAVKDEYKNIIFIPMSSNGDNLNKIFSWSQNAPEGFFRQESNKVVVDVTTDGSFHSSKSFLKKIDMWTSYDVSKWSVIVNSSLK